MTRRSIPRRLSDRYLQLRDLYRATRLDIRDIVKHDYRGGALLMIVAFWIGVLLTRCSS